MVALAHRPMVGQVALLAMLPPRQLCQLRERCRPGRVRASSREVDCFGRRRRMPAPAAVIRVRTAIVRLKHVLHVADEHVVQRLHTDRILVEELPQGIDEGAEPGRCLIALRLELVCSVCSDGVEWVCPLAPLQLQPRSQSAFAQIYSVQGVECTPPGLLPCRSTSASVCWLRQQALTLPVSFPQFFEIDARAPVSLHLEGNEVWGLPAAAALQSSAAILPLVSRVRASWLGQERALCRAGALDTEAASEAFEDLCALHDSYGDAGGGYS